MARGAQARTARVPGRRSRGSRVVAGLFALAAAALVVTVAWAGFVRQLPPGAVAILPEAARPGTAADLRGRIARDGSPVPGSGGALSPAELRHFNRRLPLHPQPYAAGGAAAFAAGDRAAGLALFEAARRQDPRSRPVRLSLARLYLEESRMDEAALELYSAAALFQGDSRLIMATIRAGSLDPRFREAVLRLVEERPERAAVLYRLITYSDALADPLVRDMIRRHPPRSSNARRIIPMLVRQGAVDEALATWRAELGLAPDAPLAWPQDPGYRRGFGSGVFGWRDRTSRLGRVAVVEDGAMKGGQALSATFSGDGSEVLLSQQVVLAPGPHGWRIPYRRVSWLGPAELVWELACPGGEPLGSARLTGAGAPSGTLTLRASVPAGCRVQELRLRAAGEAAANEADVQFGPFEAAAGAEQ